MGSPEKPCQKCKGTGRVLLTRHRMNTVTEEITSVAAGWTDCECVVEDRLVAAAKALATTPAPADVATDGPNSPGAVYDACRRATAPADDASVERVIQELGAETGIHRLYAHERMALVRAVLNTRADDATRGCTVAFCETHRDVEIVPGPFCPACLGSTCRVDGMRDGLRARRADDASGAEAMGIPGLDFQPPRDRTPKGYARVEAYMGQGHVVVMGYPTDESHNCDALGCGSTGAHVIARLPLPATDDAVEEARNAVLDAVATWRAAEKRIAAAYLRGQIDTATFTKRNDEAAAGELTEIRLASDALDAALRREKGSPR